MLGTLLICLALLLLTEYRRAFFADPISVMSLEVLAAILRTGGPGYVAGIALIVGGLFVLSGILVLLVVGSFPLSDLLSHVWRGIGGNSNL